MCGVQWSSGARWLCGALLSCVGCGGRVGYGGHVWGAVVKWGAVVVWGTVVMCGVRWSSGARWSCVGHGGRVVMCGVRWSSEARWSCGRTSGFRSRGPGFETNYCRFETWAISFTPPCPRLSEDTLKAVGPFYLESKPGEVKDPTQGNGKTCCGLSVPVP